MAPHEPVARIEALYRKRTARKCQEKTLDGTQGRTLQAVSQEARFVPKEDLPMPAPAESYPGATMSLRPVATIEPRGPSRWPSGLSLHWT
jgi:hypothetical protein